MRTLLVCGGRRFANARAVGPAFAAREERSLWDALDRLHADLPIGLIVHGGAEGADKCAGEWAASRGVDQVVYVANWTAHGLSAGPRRNRRMLERERPDLVLAAPGQKGTADMVRQARDAGVEVVEVRP